MQLLLGEWWLAGLAGLTGLIPSNRVRPNFTGIIGAEHVKAKVKATNFASMKVRRVSVSLPLLVFSFCWVLMALMRA